MLIVAPQGMPMQKYGAGWKKQRRLANQALYASFKFYSVESVLLISVSGALRQ